MSRRAIFASLFAMISVAAWAQTTIQDNFINAGETKTLTVGEYLIDGYVFVEDGATLIIEPGTVIKARTVPTTGDFASALIIARGGKIMAEGTAAQPIIFTAEADDLNNPSDLGPTDRGLWGGVILLGRATTNRTSDGQIEGIPTDEARAAYGGNDDGDNSGVMTYVSIRHGGAELGPGEEINGLTFGAVGNGTTIEHIEVYANDDDGFEWFGGTVNSKYLAAVFCRDDAFDYDEGWRGMNQFWFAVQSPDFAGRTGEHDGGPSSCETCEPFAEPHIVNATYIGPGTTAFPQGDGDFQIIFRDNAGGVYYNSIFTEFNGADGGGGINVEDLADGEDSRSRMENNQLRLGNNIWWQFGDGNTLAAIAPQDFVAAHLTANNNTIADPMINGISRDADGGLDPRPAADGPAASGAADPGNAFFSTVAFRGAFDPAGEPWIAGWTALDAEGVLASGISGTITVQDDFINAGETVTLTSENTYVLDGYVFVEEGATLIIEPGTIVKAKTSPTTGDFASALIITRGGKIMAEGTAQNPIIFTAEADNLNDATDLGPTDRGLWGGVILLGRATTNRTGDGQIEGIPTDEPRAAFGGDNDADNSGVMRYVSIRHGGAELGPGEEINGLTFGAVGSGTIIEHIEVFANDDDGFEWFGGTVDSKYLVAAFCRDDAFDYDEGWRGRNQYWFAVQSSDFAGRTGEHDGGPSSCETCQPFAQPQIANATYIGPGITAFPQGDGDYQIIFRDNAGGHYWNSIFTEFNGADGGGGINIEDLADGEDSRSRLENGQLSLVSNLWWQFGDGNTIEAIAPQDFVAAHLVAQNNSIIDPMLRGISRTTDNGLDPRPMSNSPAASGAATSDDAFFANTAFRGAFAPGSSLWTDGWTALYAYNVTSRETVTPEAAATLVFPWVSNSNEFESTLIVANPSAQPATIWFTANRADGTSETTGTATIPARGFWTIKAADLFPGLGLGPGYAVILNSDSASISGRWVTSDRVNSSPSQGNAVLVPENGTNNFVGTAAEFGYLPGNASFSSAPVIVNTLSVANEITVFFFDQDGNLVDTEAGVVDPHSPWIPKFNDASTGDTYAVAYSQAGGVTGVVFVFNAEGQTAIGNATVVGGFTVPGGN